ACHTHTYSDAKYALNTGTVCFDLHPDISVWKIINGLMVLELSLDSASHAGITAKLRECFIMPLNMTKSDYGTYHVVVGNHRIGKTTIVQKCAKKVGKGVIYVDVPPVLNKFVENFANSIGFHEHCSFIELFWQKFLGISNSTPQFPFLRVLNAFEREVKNYKANNDGKPPMLILDNISKLVQKNVEMIEDLQDLANSMLTSPVVSLCDRIKDLKTYGYWIKEGMTLKDKKVHKIVFYSIENNFHQAQIMKSEVNHAIGNVIVEKLVKNEKIEYDEFIKLVNNKEIADKLIQANVFSYNLENNFITFQSRIKKFL
ncbi:16767_t:CDS:2, partial [Funneliformis geosporum]